MPRNSQEEIMGRDKTEIIGKLSNSLDKARITIK